MHAPPPDAMGPVPFTVSRVRRETRDTSTLELAAVNGPCTFRAGQFNMLYVFGIGVPVSISGDPLREALLDHTVRAVRAITAALCRLRPGDTVGVRGPLGASCRWRRPRGWTW